MASESPRISDKLPSVDVYGLARTAGRLSGTVPVSQLGRLLPALADTAGEISYALQGAIDGRGRPAARLCIAGQLQLNCDRCGEAVDVVLDETAVFYFVPDEETLQSIPIEDIEEEPLVGSDRFDLHALVEDQVILALPAAPRHAACTAAIALDDPDEQEGDERPNPFAILGSLKRRSN